MYSTSSFASSKTGTKSCNAISQPLRIGSSVLRYSLSLILIVVENSWSCNLGVLLEKIVGEIKHVG